MRSAVFGSHDDKAGGCTRFRRSKAANVMAFINFCLSLAILCFFLTSPYTWRGPAMSDLDHQCFIGACSQSQGQHIIAWRNSPAKSCLDATCSEDRARPYPTLSDSIFSMLEMRIFQGVGVDDDTIWTVKLIVLFAIPLWVFTQVPLQAV